VGCDRKDDAFVLECCGRGVTSVVKKCLMNLREEATSSLLY